MRALITGATGGLGRAMAVECASRGMNLILTDKDQTMLDCLKTGLLRRYSIDVFAHPCELTDIASIEAFWEKIDHVGKSVDLLLNIAGCEHEGEFVLRTAEEIREIVQVNLIATLTFTHSFLIRRKMPSYVVFMSSLASQYPMPLKATYAATKRFLFDFSLALGEELAEQGLTTLVVCPGGLPTTPAKIQAIAAQGFFGGLTTNRIEVVCHQTIRRVLRGDRIYFPGIFNRILRVFSSVLPRRFIAKKIHQRWKRSQRKWLTEETQK